MIKFAYVTGDCHGVFDKFNNFNPIDKTTTAVFLLGDTGANYYGGKRDLRTKNTLTSFGVRFYLVRGNHEKRPEDLFTMETIYDEDVCGDVYYEPFWPNIRYLMDGGVYTVCGKRILVIGGAYSVDKFYRIQQGWNWFEKEQLSELERTNILNAVQGQYFDFVFTHTCPYEFQPTELFLSCIDQSTVDNSTEKWLSEVAANINWDYWCFGHYHKDMIIRPNVFMFQDEIIDINMIETFDPKTHELPENFVLSKMFKY